MRENQTRPHKCLKEMFLTSIYNKNPNTTLHKWSECGLKISKAWGEGEQQFLASRFFQTGFLLFERSVMTIQTVAHFSIKFHPHQRVTFVHDEQERGGDGALYTQGHAYTQDTGTASHFSSLFVFILVLNTGLDQQGRRSPSPLWQYRT